MDIYVFVVINTFCPSSKRSEIAYTTANDSKLPSALLFYNGSHISCKGGFPLDEFVRANRFFSSLSIRSFDITSLNCMVTPIIMFIKCCNFVERKKSASPPALPDCLWRNHLILQRAGRKLIRLFDT